MSKILIAIGAALASIALLLGAQATPVMAQSIAAPGCPSQVPCRIPPFNIGYSVGPTGDYPTVSAAYADANQMIIQTGGSVTLTVDSIIAEPAAIPVQSSFSKNIYVQGSTLSKTLTSVQSSSGSAGAWTYILNLNNVTGISVGQYFALPVATGGVNPSFLAGGWPVTAVDAVNSRVTITTTNHNATPASGAVAGAVTILKGVLKFTGTDGFDIYNGASAANLNYIAVVGDGATSHVGVSTQDGGGRFYVPNMVVVSAFGGANILANYTAQINSPGYILTTSSLGDGIRASERAPIAANIVSNGNGNNGISAPGGFVTTDTTLSSGNAGAGVSVSLGGVFVSSTSSTITGNLGKGIDSGVLGIVAATGLSSSGNGVADQLLYNVGSNGLLIGTAGGFAAGSGRPDFAAGNVSTNGYMQLASTTVSGLVTCSGGTGGTNYAKTAFVTDSTVAASGNYGAAVVGGSTNVVRVYCDGTSWKIG